MKKRVLLHLSLIVRIVRLLIFTVLLHFVTMFSKTPQTLGIKNNNPFNIRHFKQNLWLGQVGVNKGFCVFVSMDFGMRAGIYLLRAYIRKKHPIYDKCDTIAKIVNRFAPITENDTEAYIRFLCNRLKLKRNDIIVYPSVEFADLCCAICFYESQYLIPREYVYVIINQFKLY